MDPLFSTNQLPWQVEHIISKLEQHGSKAYLVGGSVRDYLLGIPPHDFDIATNAPLTVIQSIFPDSKIIGAAFGVCLVTLEGMDIQIAQFRSDGKYS